MFLENTNSDNEPNIIWEPIPGSSQEFALDTRCHHTLFHGARGPGKTITQLMRFRRRVGMGYGAYWRGIIFDREFKNLADLVAQSKRYFDKFDDGAKFHESASEYKWVWPTGEELLLRHIKKIGQYDDYHGHEYPFIGWNELTKWETGALYDKMMSCNRSSFVPEKHTKKKKTFDAKLNEQGIYEVYDTYNGLILPEIPLEVFSTTNPSGAGHNWVKKRFIDAAAPGEVVRTEVMVFDPRIQQDRIVTKTQVAIFGSYRENIYLSAEYVAELESIKDPNLKRAWLYGDWNVTFGGAFDDIFDSRVHVLPKFNIPKEWRIDRSFDWGSSEPFSVAWWAETNGEEVTLPDGSTFCPAAGSLIQIAEWYGTKEIGTNVGLKLSAPNIADGIKDREIEMLLKKFIQTKPWPGPADNQISNVNDSSIDTTEKMMQDKKIFWTKSDKSAGTNAIGLQLVRDRLEAAVRREGKALYFMRTCPAVIEILPSLQRDEVKTDEVDKDSEKHVFDTVKYRVLAGSNRLATKVNVVFGN